MNDTPHSNAIRGCLLGTAVGDSLGLPYEGMNARRVCKFFKPPLRQRFLFGKGMISDDSEHACFVAQALIKNSDNPDRFEKKLAWSLRLWFLGLPAGIGLATAKSIIKLWFGFPPKYSGVFSAGNGPAMRSPLLGIVFNDNTEKLRTFVQRSTRLTHTDPKALYGALTVALATRQSSVKKSTNPDDFLALLTHTLEDSSAEFKLLMQTTIDSVKQGENLAQFVAKIGCTKGISGYMYHTVPCVIHCWLRHQHDFRTGLEELIVAGGDTDSNGAIFGAICGAGVGEKGIPKDWINDIVEWPRSTTYMKKLSDRLQAGHEKTHKTIDVGYFFPGIVIRNVFFLAIVLFHGFRRLLPPY